MTDSHVCSNLYICPTSGETECACHGGFDVCCNHPRCPGSRMGPTDPDPLEEVCP